MQSRHHTAQPQIIKTQAYTQSTEHGFHRVPEPVMTWVEETNPRSVRKNRRSASTKKAQASRVKHREHLVLHKHRATQPRPLLSEESKIQAKESKICLHRESTSFTRKTHSKLGAPQTQGYSAPAWVEEKIQDSGERIEDPLALRKRKGNTVRMRHKHIRGSTNKGKGRNTFLTTQKHDKTLE